MTTPGVVYRLDHSTNFISWQGVVTNVATGSELMFVLGNQMSVNGFYRIVPLATGWKPPVATNAVVSTNLLGQVITAWKPSTNLTVITVVTNLASLVTTNMVFPSPTNFTVVASVPWRPSTNGVTVTNVTEVITAWKPSTNRVTSTISSAPAPKTFGKPATNAPSATTVVMPQVQAVTPWWAPRPSGFFGISWYWDGWWYWW